MTTAPTSQPAGVRAASTEAYLAERGPALAELCIACGACFAACPMTDYVGLSDADPGAVTLDLRRLARGEPGGPEAVRWVGACAKSGLCRSACPERDKGLDAMLLIRVARMNAINATKQIAPKHDVTAFPRVKTFARLQLTDEELGKWL